MDDAENVSFFLAGDQSNPHRELHKTQMTNRADEHRWRGWMFRLVLGYREAVG